MSAFYTDSFWNYLSAERRFSTHTLTAYKNDLQQFIQYCTEVACLTSVAEVRHLHIRGWMVAQMQAGMSTRTVNRRLSCLKTYFQYLRKQGYTDKDPLKKVAAPKSGKRLPASLTEGQVRALFTDITFTPDYESQLARMLLEILYATGLRRGELVRLRMADIDMGRGVFRVLGKGNKERLSPMAPYLQRLLTDFLQLRRATFPEDHVMLLLMPNGQPVHADYVYRTVKKYLSLVTTQDQRSPHVLRHSFATHLSDRGADLNAIKELLGHANLAATQIYMHNSVEKLKKVYEQAHPKGDSEEE